MIFVGDLACPHNVAPKFENLPASFGESALVVNFEGDYASENLVTTDDPVLFNSEQSGRLLERQRVAVATLANNHLFDVRDSVRGTRSFLDRHGVVACGAGDSLDEAASPGRLVEGGRTWLFLAFGWEPIRCRLAQVGTPGVNPWEPAHATSSVAQWRDRMPDAVIVVLPHWNYELEVYPQPAHRQLARRLVRAGADAVVGTHPHCVGGIEVYCGAPIVYSLGNWFLPQGVFFGGRLTYPDHARLQLAFEWSPEGAASRCHWFEYDPATHSVTWRDTEALIDSDRMARLTPYAGMGGDEYLRWFGDHRVRRKGLPIYRDCDHALRNAVRDLWVKSRDQVVKAREWIRGRPPFGSSVPACSSGD